MNKRLLERCSSALLFKREKPRNDGKGFRVKHGMTAVLAMMASVLIWTGCEVGLGESLDLEAPVVTVTTPLDDDTIAHTFTMRGTAKDNDAVKKITIDFEDASLHYRWNGGNWEKNTAKTNDWEEITEKEKASCELKDGVLEWSVYVDTAEKISTKTDATYAFSVIAYDAMENSGKTSKEERAVTLDENDPDVSVNEPLVFQGKYEDAQKNVESYTLQNGSYLSKLVNADFCVQGIQQGSIIFNELRIELDDGGLMAGDRKKTGDIIIDNPTCEELAKNASLGDKTAPKVYFSKTFKLNGKDDDGKVIDSLRNWKFNIKSAELCTEANAELKTGMHLIRIVTTSVSSSNAWERKVQGWFVWWPEADIPWIQAFDIGDKTDKPMTDNDKKAIYPASSLSGYVQDDDGIKNMSYKIEKKDAGGNYTMPISSKVITPTDADNKYLAWTIISPSDEGAYRITLDVEDVNGKKGDTVVRYFKTMDTKAPKITIETPDAGSSCIGDANGNITFIGKATDDGGIKSLCVVYLDPKKAGDANNKLQYIDGTKKDVWATATEAGIDDDGNKIFRIPITEGKFDEANKLKTYTFTRTFNIFSDFGIDGIDKKLINQEFVFNATDNGGQTSQTMFSLSGDISSPSITVDSITVKHIQGNENLYNFSGGFLTLPKFANGDKAILKGKWSDNSTDKWTDKSKIGKINIAWTGTSDIEISPKSNGTWEATITKLPNSASASIVASITDFGGSETKASASFSIENATASFDRIGAETPDGSYGTGKIITLTMEFNKPVRFSNGTPSLELNNGGVATYDSGNATLKHLFKYTVNSSDTDVEKLDTTKLNANGATWLDATTNASVIGMNALPQDNNSLAGGRNICIDKTPPKIKALTAKTAPGDYKEGASIIMLLEFSEDVTIDDDTQLCLNLSGSGQSWTTTAASKSGSKQVLFTYTVASGKNASPLHFVSFDKGTSTITDVAGNALDTTFQAKDFQGINIDTVAPSAPRLSLSTSSAIVYDMAGMSFTVQGENGCNIEYTVDNGSSWQVYNGKVSLVNNGTYTIKARQSDKAGNKSPESSASTVTVDKGDLLTKIYSDNTLNGTYSTGKTITIDLTFRKPVTLPTSSTVMTNIKNGSTFKTASMTTTGEQTRHSFSYTIVNGDGIQDSGGFLDVTGFSFTTVEVSGVQVPISVPSATGSDSGKRFKNNREIKIVTGKPVIQNVTLTGQDANAKLTITFDRSVTKGTGSVTLTQSDSGYKAPSVLTEEEYNNAPNAAKSHYTEGVQGATKSGSTLTNDTSVKYVLNYTENVTDTALVTAWASKKVVTIPSFMSNVSVNDKVMTIALTDSYKIPVKGAVYSVNIPQGFAVDELSNKNDAKTQNDLTAPGVEKPFIRVKKSKETITGAGDTKTASATQPLSAQFKIDCQTPGATIKYGKNEKTSTTRTYGWTGGYNKVEPTANATVVNAETAYADGAEITLGGGSSSYSRVKGLKIAITATATKGSFTSTSYEYATRSVFKVKIKDEDNNWEYYGWGSDSEGNLQTSITENGGKLTLKDLQMWIRGGDDSFGAVSTPGFPLSWRTTDYSGVHLMTGGHYSSYDHQNKSDAEEMQGEWYYVTWDLSHYACVGPLVGDVPSDAATNGPGTWYFGTAGFLATSKDLYRLYPGETLELHSQNDGNKDGCPSSKILFGLNDRGSRFGDVVPSVPTVTKVTLSCTHDAGSGNAVFFAGTFKEAGNWTNIVRGVWGDGNVWTATVTVPSSGSFVWKPCQGSYNLGETASQSGSSLLWQEGSGNVTYPSSRQWTWQ